MSDLVIGSDDLNSYSDEELEGIIADAEKILRVRAANRANVPTEDGWETEPLVKTLSRSVCAGTCGLRAFYRRRRPNGMVDFACERHVPRRPLDT